MRRRSGCPSFAAIAACLLTSAGAAAPVTQSTPAVEPVSTPRQLQFEFLFSHHFQVVGPKLLNSPTFTLEGGVIDRVALMARYSSSSDIGDRVNELEAAVHAAVLEQERGAPLSLAAYAGYNTAARSADLSVVAARTFGPLLVLAALRGFSDGFGVAGWMASGALGLRLQLTPRLFLVADAGRALVAEFAAPLQERGHPWAWSAGLAFEIPFTPHSMSLYATNINTLSLHGRSRGSDTLRVGFEFAVPFTTIERWAGIFSGAPDAPGPASAPEVAQPASARTVRIVIRDFKYLPEALTIAPGTTVEWINEDKVPHTVTESSHAWDSGIIAPGESWRRTFEVAGEIPYYCTLHPFQKARLLVE